MQERKTCGAHCEHDKMSRSHGSSAVCRGHGLGPANSSIARSLTKLRTRVLSGNFALTKRHMCLVMIRRSADGDDGDDQEASCC